MKQTHIKKKTKKKLPTKNANHMSASSCNFCNNYSKQMQDHNKCNCQIEFACHDVCLLPCSQWDETMQLHSRGIFHLIRITTVIPDVTRPSKERPQLSVFKALLIPSMTAERWNSFVINYPDKPMCCIEKKWTMTLSLWVVIFISSNTAYAIFPQLRPKRRKSRENI